MEKHPLDHTHAPSKARMREFTRIEREAMARPQSQNLQERKDDSGPSGRLKAFVAIERGKTA